MFHSIFILLSGAITVSRTQIKALPWPRNTVILLQQITIYLKLF